MGDKGLPIVILVFDGGVLMGNKGVEFLAKLDDLKKECGNRAYSDFLVIHGKKSNVRIGPTPTFWFCDRKSGNRAYSHFFFL